MTESTTNKTGADLLAEHLTKITDTGISFLSSINLDNYLEESWPSLPYAENTKYKATSANGSILTLLNTSSLANGRETAGAELSFTGSDGTRLSTKFLNKQPQNEGYGPVSASIAVDWVYGGSKAFTSDDLHLLIFFGKPEWALSSDVRASDLWRKNAHALLNQRDL